MATIVYASDLHGNHAAYEKLFSLDADAIVLGGDLLPYTLKRGGDLLGPQRQFAEAFLAPLMSKRPCYWIPGNDDWAAALGPLESAGIPLHGRVAPFLDGLSIAGLGLVPITPFGMKDFDRTDVTDWKPVQPPERCLRSTAAGIVPIPLQEVESRPTIEAELETLAAKSDPSKTVYVVHSPPYATTLDRLQGGIRPIGSRALRAFIEKRRPPLTLHGHVHESSGVERLGGTVCVNPGDSMRRLRALRIDLKTFEVGPP